jgi:hypothetical protein
MIVAVDCLVEIGVVMIGAGVVNFVGPRSVREAGAHLADQQSIRRRARCR